MVAEEKQKQSKVITFCANDKLYLQIFVVSGRINITENYYILGYQKK